MLKNENAIRNLFFDWLDINLLFLRKTYNSYVF